MSAVTQWFDADVKPARKGFYQRMYSAAWLLEQPDYWDGKQWFNAFNFKHGKVPSQTKRQWRGLAVKP